MLDFHAHIWYHFMNLEKTDTAWKADGQKTSVHLLLKLYRA